jgi:hypothetical protein
LQFAVVLQQGDAPAAPRPHTPAS